ncbi:MAG: RNA-binding protein [bacterium]
MENKKLYVGNLAYQTTEEELRELFAPYGEIAFAKVIEQKGFGFVEMSTVEAAEKAKNELNSQEYKGRMLKIDYARPQERREGGFRGGSSGGGGGNRSGGSGGGRSFSRSY